MSNEKNNLPFDPEGNIFHWGPVPGKFLYCSVFTHVHYTYFRAKYEENWSETLWLFQNNRMFWINDTDDVRAAGLKVFLKYMLPKDKRSEIYQEWQGYVKDLNVIENKIDTTDLTKISDDELKKTWHDFHQIYIKFWVSGSVPELANYGVDKYLIDSLKQFVVDEKELASVMEVLTAPTRLSFYQEEEIDLQKSDDLVKHQQQYFWLKNSYAGTQVLPVDFFAQRKPSIKSEIEEEMKNKMSELPKQKMALKEKYNLSEEVWEIIEAVSDGVGWQDERKKYIFMVLHYQDVMLKEIEKRFNYTWEELDTAWYYEIEKIIVGENLHNILQKRLEGFGVRFFHECEELDAKQVEFFWQLYDSKSEEGALQAKGIVASKGNGGVVKGKVRILLDPTKVDSFVDGEILLAPMTSPEYVFVMKKSLAVVTDTGGLTSHAAIVSRELNIPCLVGTKNATKIFKDGDVVEVDANEGVVRKI
ncbi:MAG TPA: hypothetical protein DCS29_04025 [Candidatus Magasanikbacteria bacterium]|nr:hypothetical protein [Candidatus Magasanikbacteria bacterium]